VGGVRHSRQAFADRPGKPHGRGSLRLSCERPAYRRAYAGRAQALCVAQGRRARGIRCGAAKVRGQRTDGEIASGNGSGSEGITPTGDGKHLLALDNERNDLRVIDIATDREIDRVPLDGNPFSNIKRSRLAKLMFSPDGKHLVVTTYASGLAWLIDAADLRRQTRVPVAKGPQGIAFAPDGKSALVSSHDSGLLTRIALADGCAVAAHDGGAGIEVLAYY
jgi:DNA-binding beta-propeller fold protein YncE